MQLNRSRSLLALFLLGFLLGCSGADPTNYGRTFGPLPVSTNIPCDFTPDTHSSGLIKYNSTNGGLVLKPNQNDCSVKFSKRAYIVLKDNDGDHNEVKRIRSFLLPQEIQTDGSCRWCYPNTAGGMSCIVYNPPGGICPFGTMDTDEPSDKRPGR